MNHPTACILSTLAALCPAERAPAQSAGDPTQSVLRIVVQAQPGDAVLLLLSPSLGTPTQLPGCQGLLALDPGLLVNAPGAPTDATGVSMTLVPLPGFVGMPLYLQPAIRSPRDPASGHLQPPRRLR